MYIAVAGNIGSGKTTLTKLLAEHFQWAPEFESVNDNPYLKDFYGDMERWSFHLQVYFLNSRFNQIRKITQRDSTVIQDRSIYEDAYIFAKNLVDSSMMNRRDFENYYALFESMLDYVQPPKLLIYLDAEIPRLVQNIKSRGRDFEKNIPINYLINLNDLYRKWINGYNHGNLLRINMKSIDFVNNKADFYKIVEQVEAKISEESSSV